MKSISILGCGWLGMPLGASLAKEDYQVKGSTRSREKLEEIEANGMEAFRIDLSQPEEISSEFFESDVLILNIPPSSAETEEVYHAQLDIVLNQIETRRTHVLFVSSTGVYPNLNREVKEEDADPNTTSRSGISLLKAERKFHLPIHTVLRFGGLIDERRHPGKWFAGKTGLTGGNVPVNMIHLNDCIGAISTVLEKEYWGDVFNACHPDHPTKAEYYTKMSETLGLEPPKFSSEELSDWKIVSVEKFLTATDYKFQHSIWEI